MRRPSIAGMAAAAIAVAILAVLFAGIVVNHFLMVDYVRNFNDKQIQAQARNSVGLCRAILEMDQAGNGATHSTDATYGARLATAIHEVYVQSRCPEILSGTFRPPS